MKPDFPSLLPAGKHALSLEGLRELTVSPFNDGGYRANMFVRLETWIRQLNDLDVHGSIWLDGSFLTQKPEPGDIDCVLWHPRFTNTPNQAQLDSIRELVDRQRAKASFGLDFYLEICDDSEKFHRQAYWMGVLGFAHDRQTAKGFAEVTI